MGNPHHVVARAAVIERLDARRLLATINSGEIIVGNLATSSEVDSYTINVSAGAPFLVALERYVVMNQVLTPRLKVLAPGGATLIDEVADPGLTRLIPTATSGTYEIRVSAQASSGEYKLAAFRPTANVAEADRIAAVSGRRYAATLAAGDIDIFTLESDGYETFGASVMEATPGATFSPRVTLVDAYGDILGDGVGEIGAHVRDRVQGPEPRRVYAIVADNGNNDGGNYGFTMFGVPAEQDATDPDAAALTPGVARTGTLLPGEIDVFTLARTSGSDDRVLTITVTRPDGSTIHPDVTFFNSNGEELARGTRSNSDKTSTIVTSYPVFSDADYIVVREWESDAAGDYTIMYTLADRVPPATLVNGVLRVDGTAGNDGINILEVGNDGVRAVSVQFQGFNNAIEFPIGDVDRIEVYGNDGDDEIALYESLTHDTVVFGGNGNDYVATRGSGRTTLSGGDGNDTMNGGNAAEYFTGGSGDDHITGGVGDDSITGGGGRNRLFGGEGNDLMRGSNGRDFLYGEGGDDRLNGEPGNDNLDGGGNKDRLTGGDGDDLLEGGGSNDQIYGGAGNDTLIGASGADNLFGGPGTDTSRWHKDEDSLFDIELQVF